MSVSPAEPPAAPRARLSRERVLTAALALLDEKGLDQLTMRRLAHQLGRDPMALYRYLPNRAALLDGVVELFLAQLPARSRTWTGKPSCAPARTTSAGLHSAIPTWCRC